MNELSYPVQSSTSEIGDKNVDKDEEGTWFWNKSANESESDSECGGYSDEEKKKSSEPEGSRIEKEALPQ